MTHKTTQPRAPGHLQAATRAWFDQVIADYELEAHHVRLLSLACESWDRCGQAREALAAGGLTVTDRFGFPRARPEVAIERDSRIAFARLCRELDLDTDAPSASPRLPALNSNRRP
jgi:phage terminase small subunit